MDKLEIHHITPYLPYGLKSVTTANHYGVPQLIREVTPYNFMNFIEETTDAKLLLRPLSDLQEKITVNGVSFIPEEVLFNLKFDYEISVAMVAGSVVNKRIEVNPYWMVQKLFEWNFDVFGLIEKGLAKNINEIKN